MQKVTGHGSHVSSLSLGRPGLSISFGKGIKLYLVIHDLFQHHSQPESEAHWSLPGHRHMLWALFPHAGYYILSTCFYLNVKIIKQHIDKLI